MLANSSGWTDYSICVYLSCHRNHKNVKLSFHATMEVFIVARILEQSSDFIAKVSGHFARKPLTVTFNYLLIETFELKILRSNIKITTLLRYTHTLRAHTSPAFIENNVGAQKGIVIPLNILRAHLISSEWIHTYRSIINVVSS